MLAVLLLGLVAMPALAAETKCARPEIELFLENARTAINFTGSYFPSPEVKYLSFEVEGRTLQWLGASWWGPREGALFVLDCQGKRVAALPLGFVMKLRNGPVVPGFGRTFEVDYISGVGTGVKVQTIYLVAFKDGAISIVWSHQGSDSEGNYGYAYEETVSPRFSRDGMRIDVLKKREVGPFKDPDYGWPPNTTHVFPVERFCWIASSKSFAACGK